MQDKYNKCRYSEKTFTLFLLSGVSIKGAGEGWEGKRMLYL
jgi:hypothetical protein